MEEKIEQVQQEENDEIDLGSMFESKNTKERLENWSFIITLISGLMVALGIGLGSFVQGSIYVASFGSFFFVIGKTIGFYYNKIKNKKKTTK